MRAAAGAVFTTTSRYARPPTRSSRSIERFFPRRAKRWTLPMVRRHLQLVLLRRIGWCPLRRIKPTSHRGNSWAAATAGA